MDVLGAAANVLEQIRGMERFYTYRDHTATAIAGFKLAKTAIEIAKVTKAMTLLRVAKIKDKAETLYLNALYAKDAIVKAASTAATWAQTAATTAWNVVRHGRDSGNDRTGCSVYILNQSDWLSNSGNRSSNRYRCITV